MPSFSPPTTVLNAKASTGIGTTFPCKDYKNIVVAVSAPLNASLTYKFQGSIGSGLATDAAPTFSTAQSVTNHWDYIAFTDMQTAGTLVAGDTGVTIDNDTAANNTHLYMINTEGLSWLNMEVTAYTDGSVSAFVVGFTY